MVEGADGKRIALVKNDLYIPQDLLWRRTAQILEQGNSGIGHNNLTMAVTHDHSSPYYSSLGAGAWTFQDVFDVRFYNYGANADLNGNGTIQSNETAELLPNLGFITAAAGNALVIVGSRPTARTGAPFTYT